jgi:hypothetical protein
MINIEQKPKNCKKNYSKIPFKGSYFEMADKFQTLTSPISKTLKEKNIRPKLKVSITTQDKKPIEKNFYGSGFKSVTIDYCGVKFKKHNASNLGIICGIYGNLNLVVLDIDPKNGFKQKYIKQINKALGSTYIVKTPSGGIHLYYLSEDLTIKSRPFPGIKGLDIKANGGFVMAAGNKIPAGEYKLDWENDNYLPTVSMLPTNWEKIIEKIVLGKETETFSLLSLTTSKSVVVNTNTKKANLLKPKKQVNLETVEVLTKTHVFALVKVLKTNQLRVPEGYRNTVACRIVGSLIKKRKGFDFIYNELKSIRDISFENPKTFLDEEIEMLIRSLISKENKKQNTNLKNNERINGFVFGGEFSENRWIDYIFKEVIKESKKTYGIKPKQFKKKKSSKASSSGISLKWRAHTGHCGEW